jgi:nucleoside-diphosphate-sugar epimerase
MPDNPLAADLDHVLDHTRGLWEELRGERIFITGGTGFFGCWLLESFVWANDRLDLKSSALVITRNQEAFGKKVPHLASHPAIQFLSGDIRSFDFPSGTFSHIIHAATDSNPTLNVQNPDYVKKNIIEGTQRTWEFAHDCGARKYLLTSSGAVYGRQPPEMTHIPEEYQGDSLSVFGLAKRAAESLCTDSKHNTLETKIARCFAFVGPYLPINAHYAIGNFIRDGLNGGPIIVLGDGTPHRSYLYASDLVIWLWTILFKGQSRRPYNVGSSESISIADLAHRVAAQFPKKIDVEIKGALDPGKLIEQYVPNIDRAKNELSLDQFVSTTDAIQKTIEFYLGNPKTN